MTTHKKEVPKPIILNAAKADDRAALAQLKASQPALRVVDTFLSQLEEYYHMQYPALPPEKRNDIVKKHIERTLSKSSGEQLGRWVYFPWSNTLMHILEPKQFHFVRTNRNRNLITEEEQKHFKEAHIGIAGLSVGSSIIYTIVLEGGGDHITLADSDTLALSNMNRIRSSIEDLGKPKINIIAEQIYSLNPYATLTCFPEGLTEENIKRFFTGLDIVIDEIDSLAMKFHMREIAKRKKIPLVSAADEGDSGVITVERYDLNIPVKPFEGRMRGYTARSIAEIKRADIGPTIARLIGPENIPERMQQSLLEVGSTLASWPQLGGTAALNGAAIAFCIRQILSGKPTLPSAIVSLEELLIPNFNSAKEKLRRKKYLNTFIKKYRI